VRRAETQYLEYEKNAKSHKNSQKGNSQPAKSEIEWGRVRMQRIGEFIASVGSPSGRWVDDVRTLAASERRILVELVWTVERDVQTMMTASVRTPSGPVQTCGLHPHPDSKRVPSGSL
jgi:hypothetical protein